MKISSTNLPGEEFRDGMSRQDRRAISIGDPLNFWLEIFVSDNREFGFEGFAVSCAGEFVAFQVLSLGVSFQNFRQHRLLDGVGVSGGLFDKL